MSSKLYICGNHLGSIKDVPSRTVSVLKEADLILCEDTRTMGILLSELEIQNKKLLSYFDYNERTRTTYLKNRLENEELVIALISEAGMPIIADPGYHIINLFHEMNLEIEVVPGPTAFVSALVLSGFSIERAGFRFVGFWPRKKSSQQKIISALIEEKVPYVFYESPKRVTKTLELIQDSSNNIQVFVVKEMTKKYEQYWRGFVTEVVNELSKKDQKGEFAVVVLAN